MACRFWGYDFALEEDEDSNELEQTPAGVTTLPLTRDIGAPPQPPASLHHDMASSSLPACILA